MILCTRLDSETTDMLECKASCSILSKECAEVGKDRQVEYLANVVVNVQAQSVAPCSFAVSASCFWLRGNISEAFARLSARP